MASGHSLPQVSLSVQGGSQGGNIHLRREQSPVHPCFDLHDLSHIGNGLFCSPERLISEENSHQLIHALISKISATLETDSFVLSHKLNAANFVLK
ncbi:hypothetical protein TNCV_3468761 [Trichonephila clavipes]|nr:hypothetical protein TNCV_3468761 [Trichonephila clavipes]